MPAPIIWLASYPRSGNTWMRTLLFSYFHGRPESSKDIAKHFPDLHVEGQYDPAAAGRQIVKTHLPFGPNHAHIERTAGAIVMLRHPKDVLLSSLDFHHVLGTKTNMGGLEPDRFADVFIEQGGDPIWIQNGFGSWAQFYDSWSEETGTPRLVLKYEEMRADAVPGLRRAVQFLGEAADESRLAQAAKMASFDNMRAMEIREKAKAPAKNVFFGGNQGNLRKGELFMRKGRVGASLDDIRPGLDAAFERAFGAALGRHGY
ncbi:MAG: sulfotransferase domain-containing protein [Phycisphaerales bacterium]